MVAPRLQISAESEHSVHVSSFVRRGVGQLSGIGYRTT